MAWSSFFKNSPQPPGPPPAQAPGNVPTKSTAPSSFYPTGGIYPETLAPDGLLAQLEADMVSVAASTVTCTTAATSAAASAAIASAYANTAAVRYDIAQTLTGPQATQARSNIGITSLSITLSGHAIALGGSYSIVAADVGGLAASATTDTTNATNISSGTLPAARLPNPTAATLGGVQSAAAVSHQWIDSISTAGVPHLSQPAAADISGLGTAATLNVGTGASQIVQMTAGTKLPAVDGSLLTNLPTAIVRGAIFGLAMSAPGAGTTLTINAGQATSDDFSTQMTLASGYTKTTASWAVGTALGGLDTGAIAASTWYHVYLIERTDTGVVDVLISLSASSPTMPTNYTKKRRIGAVKTDGSSKFLGFTQLGDEFLWLAPVADMSGTASSTSANSLTLSVPTNVQVWSKVIFGCVYSSASISALMYAPDTGTQTDNTPTLHYQLFVSSTSVGAQAELHIRTNTSAQVKWTASAVGSNMYCITKGWLDTRGKDA